MKAKIKSTVAFYPTRNGQLGYVTREIYKWNIDLEKNQAIPLIKEEVYIEVEETKKVDDGNGNLVDETYTERKVVETLKKYASAPFKESDVNVLFKALQNPIEVSEDFMSELRLLLQQALLMDTRSFTEKFYGLEDAQLELDNGQLSTDI